MPLAAGQLDGLTRATAEEAWGQIIESTLAICREPLCVNSAANEVTKRDLEVGRLDHFLASMAWDLWEKFGSVVGRNAEELAAWWAEPLLIQGDPHPGRTEPARTAMDAGRSGEAWTDRAPRDSVWSRSSE